MFITFEDCLKISQAYKSEENTSLLLLSAPKGSTIEATDLPYKGKH